MQSGVEVDEDVIEVYKKVKQSKGSLSGALAKLNDAKTKIVVDEKLDACEETPYLTLMEKLDSNICR